MLEPLHKLLRNKSKWYRTTYQLAYCCSLSTTVAARQCAIPASACDNYFRGKGFPLITDNKHYLVNISIEVVEFSRHMTDTRSFKAVL